MADVRPVPFLTIVDHTGNHRGQVVGALGAFYRISDYGDTDSALRGVRTLPPDLILVDDLTPPLGGFEFVRQVRRDRTPGLAAVPVIVTSKLEEPALQEAVRQCGANAYLLKPYRYSALMKAVTTLLNRQVEAQWETLPAPQRAALRGTLDVFESLSEIIETGTQIDYVTMQTACEPLVDVIAQNDFRALLSGVRNHDNYTYAHSVKVATMLCLFGSAIGLDRPGQLLLACGGLLHDTGKMMIPHEVLNKPGRLEPGEWEVMRTHVPVTLEFLQAGLAIPKGAVIIAAQHHEKLDGTGYPHGLKGTELNELARMAAIVDIFSALTDRRIYKPAMPVPEALALMSGPMAGHLDQHLLRLFRELVLDTTGGVL
ncbi:MAG: HD domain-containing phosphohydrolase [Rhodospirillaceae bacterium]